LLAAPVCQANRRLDARREPSACLPLPSAKPITTSMGTPNPALACRCRPPSQSPPRWAPRTQRSLAAAVRQANHHLDGHPEPSACLPLPSAKPITTSMGTANPASADAPPSDHGPAAHPEE
jgi:hypothetical protein